MNPIESFKCWRRKPFKNILCRAYSDGLINSYQMHELAARMDNPAAERTIPKGGYAAQWTRACTALVLCVSLALAGILTSCSTSSQTVAYKTLYGLETGTTAAYTAYIQLVVAGTVSTNAVPIVSKVYNQFQSDAIVALDAVQYSTNALAPASLVVEASDVVNAINTAKGTK